MACLVREHMRTAWFTVRHGVRVKTVGVGPVQAAAGDPGDAAVFMVVERPHERHQVGRVGVPQDLGVDAVDRRDRHGVKRVRVAPLRRDRQLVGAGQLQPDAAAAIDMSLVGGSDEVAQLDPDRRLAAPQGDQVVGIGSEDRHRDQRGRRCRDRRCLRCTRGAPRHRRHGGGSGSRQVRPHRRALEHRNQRTQVAPPHRQRCDVRGCREPARRRQAGCQRGDDLPVVRRYLQRTPIRHRQGSEHRIAAEREDGRLPTG